MSDRMAAVFGSFTIERILRLMKSAAVSFAALSDQHVLERGAELQSAALPCRFVDRLALLGRGLDRQAFLDPERHPVERLARAARISLGVLLDVSLEFRASAARCVPAPNSSPCAETPSDASPCAAITGAA